MDLYYRWVPEPKSGADFQNWVTDPKDPKKKIEPELHYWIDKDGKFVDGMWLKHLETDAEESKGQLKWQPGTGEIRLHFGTKVFTTKLFQMIL